VGSSSCLKQLAGSTSMSGDLSRDGSSSSNSKHTTFCKDIISGDALLNTYEEDEDIISSGSVRIIESSSSG